MAHEKMKNQTWRTVLNILSAIILLVGLSSAVAVYFITDSGADNEAGYEVVGKNVYPAMHERSKKYMHDLELYGGKAAVLADEINRWFEGLWHGQTLAFTIAVLAIALSLGIYSVTRLTFSGIRVNTDEISKRE
jgi:hypothetical protein